MKKTKLFINDDFYFTDESGKCYLNDLDLVVNFMSTAEFTIYKSFSNNTDRVNFFDKWFDRRFIILNEV